MFTGNRFSQASRVALEDAGMGDVAKAIHEGRETVDAAMHGLQGRFHKDLIHELAPTHAARPSHEVRYAATGIFDTQAPTGGDYHSDFEWQAAVAREGLGHEDHRQVGTAGLIIGHRTFAVSRFRP